MRSWALAVMLAVAGCGGKVCDINSPQPLPAEGCCDGAGACVYPPSYLPACRAFHRSECGAEEYAPRFEGQEPWVECPAVEPDRPFTPCPVSWLLSG